MMVPMTSKVEKVTISHNPNKDYLHTFINLKSNGIYFNILIESRGKKNQFYVNILQVILN